jgi:EAL domain-containing protein (putative c-di-GMP-specific phosphodiesterase class I)
VIIASGLDRSLVGSIETMAKAYGTRLLGALAKPVKAHDVERLFEIYRRTGVRPSKAPCVPQIFSDQEISRALTNGEFQAFFQPKVRVSDGSVVGAEALARWLHPEAGVLSPDVFLKSLEKRGFGSAFAMTMLEKAIDACQAWNRISMPGTVSVNLSVNVLKDLAVADRLMAMVRGRNIESRQVVFEVTEHSTVTPECLENLSRLRMKGFGLSMDDFGIAYSSMERLASIAFTELKIDRAFVADALRSESGRAVLDASLEMARKLNVTAVAEGVETHLEWEFLRERGCDQAQGFFIGHPMSAHDYQKWLLERRSR